jgi:hypothetical protein
MCSLQQKRITQKFDSDNQPCIIINRNIAWRDGRVVEGAALEML